MLSPTISEIPEDSDSVCSNEEEEDLARLDIEGGCGGLLQPGCQGKTRRRRTAFTSEQLLELEKVSREENHYQSICAEIILGISQQEVSEPLREIPDCPQPEAV